MDTDLPTTYNLQLRKLEDFWVLTCQEDRGVYMADTSMTKVLSTFEEALELLNKARKQS